MQTVELAENIKKPIALQINFIIYLSLFSCMIPPNLSFTVKSLMIACSLCQAIKNDNNDILMVDRGATRTASWRPSYGWVLPLPWAISIDGNQPIADVCKMSALQRLLSVAGDSRIGVFGGQERSFRPRFKMTNQLQQMCAGFVTFPPAAQSSP